MNAGIALAGHVWPKVDPNTMRAFGLLVVKGVLQRSEAIDVLMVDHSDKSHRTRHLVAYQFASLLFTLETRRMEAFSLVGRAVWQAADAKLPLERVMEASRNDYLLASESDEIVRDVVSRILRKARRTARG